MKFGRYLEETQTPEWKKAYINYKGLKKYIAAIRKARQTAKPQKTGSSLHPNLLDSQVRRPSYGSTDTTPQPTSRRRLSKPDKVSEVTSNSPEAASRMNRSINDGIFANSSAHGDEEQTTTSSIPRLLTIITRRGSSKVARRSDLTMEGIYSTLTSLELEFFTYLDHELEKVDDFYNQRETAAIHELADLKIQLRELSQHRRIVHQIQALRPDPWKFPRAFGEAVGITKGKIHHLEEDLGRHAKDGNEYIGTISSPARHDDRHDDPTAHDPSEYHHAKRRLKKALREYYRGLDLLNDYRILNLTGFRKALKKYEKVTGQHIQDLYIEEKVTPRRFSFSDSMSDAMRDIENTYAAMFENGDRKRARMRLKSLRNNLTHYFSTFRSGLFIGLGLPALVFSLYNSFQPHVREEIPQWGPLLEIYAVLMIFVVFALLLGINMLTWIQARINYQFIFELDVRTAIDSRVYFEFPALLFATLSGAMWLSFFLIGSSNIAPTTWPLIWLVFAAILLFNPFPLFSRTSRFWLLRHIARLIAAGALSVEFADFWLGDQFCSLAFPIAHLYTIGCAYHVGWQNVFQQCGSTSHWTTFVLYSLPYFSRSVQSVRRYYDSKLPTHLINAGKYGSSIMMYAVYYNWRMKGSKYDSSFVVWCVFSTLSSIYTSSWDILMDWSFFQRRRPHPLLRPELIYTNGTLLYYFAIITNIMLRFIWVLYIPQKGWLNRRVVAAIAAGCEMLRRFQWNFFRLENEQIGNTDQYRATREVPLPYAGRNQVEDDDKDEFDIGGDDTEDQPALDRNGKKPVSLKLSRLNRPYKQQMHRSPPQSPITVGHSNNHETSGSPRDEL